MKFFSYIPVVEYAWVLCSYYIFEFVFFGQRLVLAVYIYLLVPHLQRIAWDANTPFNVIFFQLKYANNINFYCKEVFLL